MFLISFESETLSLQSETRIYWITAARQRFCRDLEGIHKIPCWPITGEEPNMRPGEGSKSGCSIMISEA